MKYRIRITYNDYTERYIFVESDEPIVFDDFRIGDHLTGSATDNVIALSILQDRYR